MAPNAAPHFLDQLSPETRARISAEDIMRMEQQSNIAKQAREMRPVMDLTGVENPSIFRKDPPGHKFPSFRYNQKTGESRIIQGPEGEENGWTNKVPVTFIPTPLQATVKTYDAEVERLEDENEALRRQLQELQAKLGAKAK